MLAAAVVREQCTQSCLNHNSKGSRDVTRPHQPPKLPLMLFCISLLLAFARFAIFFGRFRADEVAEQNFGLPELPAPPSPLT
jgi:hypothetical protein